MRAEAECVRADAVAGIRVRAPPIGRTACASGVPTVATFGLTPKAFGMISGQIATLAWMVECFRYYPAQAPRGHLREGAPTCPNALREWAMSAGMCRIVE